MAASSRSARLLAALELGARGDEHAALIGIHQQHRASELVSSMPRAQLEALFSLLHEHLSYTLRVAAYSQQDAGSRGATNSLAALTVLAEITSAGVNASNHGAGKNATKVISATLFQSVQLFHDALLSFPHPAGSVLQNTLSLMFERICTQHMTVRASTAVPDASGLSTDNLLPMTLSYLLLRCLEVADAEEAVGKKSDLVRLYAMRQGLTLFDYDDDSSAGVKQLLIRCMMHPLFLRNMEGRRFLSFVLVGLGLGATSSEGHSVNADMMRLLHSAIKHQLPLCKPSFIALYADIYVRAWRACGNDSAHAGDASTAAGQQLETFEQEVLQDLMHAAIHCAHPKTSRALQSLLTASFHDPAHKKVRGVEEMLSRLYEPILWRALKAANPLVRRNATLVFIDVFPLVNPDAGSASGGRNSASSFGSNQELLQFQFDSLLALLSDEDVSVRVLGVTGIAKILAAYWEMLPLAVSKKLVVKLTADMMHDSGAGSAAVRVAVCQGLAYILDNALSHALLKVLLPTIAASLFDSSEQVQAAFVELLHAAKRARGIKYYEVASVDQLLLALQTAHSPKIVGRLLDLLLNSYFPAGKPMDSVLTRVLTLARANPAVFLRVMGRLHEHTDEVTEDRRIEFTLALYKLLLKNVKAQKDKFASAAAASKADGGRKGKKAAAAAPSSNSMDPLFLDVGDVALFDTLLSALVLLFRHLDEATMEEECMQQRVLECFADGGVSLLLSTLGARSAAARISLIHLSALLPDACSPDLHEISLPHLLELAPGAPHAEYAPVLECMVAWGRTEELLMHVHASIRLGFDDDLAREYFAARARAATEGNKDAIAKRNGLEKDFRAKYQEEFASLLQTKQPKAPARGKKSAAAAAAAAAASASAPSFDASMPLLHPWMALQYLLFLLEHDKTRSAVLGSGVEWVLPGAPSTSSSGSSAAAAMPAHGRAVGFLASIIGLFSAHLIPACRRLVEDSDASVEATEGQRVHMAFLHMALQADLKTSLHIHARIKLLAQRADQLAAEAAEAAATAALASDGDAVLAAALPVVPRAADAVDLLPSSVEGMLDFSTYVLLPFWSSTVDHRPVAGNHAPTEDSDESKDESTMHAVGAHSKKRSRKVSRVEASAVSGSAEQVGREVASVGSFMTAHFLFLARFATELLTLGFFHLQCPLRHMQAWLEHFGADAAAAAANNNDAAASAATTADRLDRTQNNEFLSQFLPLMFKALFQLSCIGSLTDGFGTSKEEQASYAGGEVQQALMASSAHLTLHALASFWRSLVTLLGCSGQAASLLPSTPLIKAGVADSLARFDRTPAVQSKLLWTALEAIVDKERYAACAMTQHEWMLPLTPLSSTAELGPYALLLLSTIARSPACVQVLPRMLRSVADRCAKHPSPNDGLVLSRLGSAISALSSLAEVHVKMPQKRRLFLNTLVACTDQLASIATSVPSVPAAAAAAPAQPPAAPVAPAAVADEASDEPVAMELDDASVKAEPVDAENKPPEQQAAPAAKGINSAPLHQADVQWSALKDALSSKLAAIPVA